MTELCKLHEYISEGEEVLDNVDERSFAGLLAGKSAARYQYWETRVLSFLRTFLPAQSLFFDRAESLARNAHRQGGIHPDNVLMLIAHLRAVCDAIDSGEVERVEQKIAANDFEEFLDFARAFRQNDQKNQAAVVAAAVFEGTIRHIADVHGIDRGQKIEVLINAMKSQSVITKLTSKKLKASADVRAAAFHAAYDEFEGEDVDQLIADTAGLLGLLRASVSSGDEETSA